MPQPPLRIQRQDIDQLTCWQVSLKDAELRVAEQGAQVLSYGRQGERPVVWLSEQAAFARGQSLRGGVPVCWPWFGDLSRNPEAVRAMHEAPAEAPFHGLVRALPWQLADLACADGAAELVFTLPLPDGGLPRWPHAVAPRLTLRLAGDGLTLSLSSHNLGQAPAALSQALHTYLAVGDIHQAGIVGLDGCRYLDTLDDWHERRQDGEVRFSGETDRIYLDTPGLIQVNDPAWQRRLCLETRGSRSAIVWNPWIDKAQRLSQFADDAWQRMLCIETANVMDDAVTLAPGAETGLSVRLWAEPLTA